MEVLSKMRIKSRMNLFFVLIVTLFIFFGLISIYHIRVLADLTSTLYRHPLAVSNAALQAKSGVTSIYSNMKDVIASTNQVASTVAIQEVLLLEKEVFKNLEIVNNRILGQEGKNLIEETISMFRGWKSIRVEIETLALEGNTEKARQVIKEKGATYIVGLEHKMQEVTFYARNKATGFMAKAERVETSLITQALLFIIFLSVVIFLIVFFISASILSNVRSLKDTMMEISKTGTLKKSTLEGNNEISEMAGYFNGVVEKLEEQFWLGRGRNLLNEELAGELSSWEMFQRSISAISRYVEACTGALYAFNTERQVCELKASYAFVERKHLANVFALGEGIVGQVAVEHKGILLKNVSEQDAVGQSGTVSEPVKALYALPIIYKKDLVGVLEVASFHDISAVQQQFLTGAADVLAGLFFTTYQKDQIQVLLEESQRANETLQHQAEELQKQTEELRIMNEESQQQSTELKEQNVELEVQRQQVELANRLKSEFLSNMSHELRTPLNSVNALSKVLRLQAKDKLNEEETSYLEIIERNGKHLLSLINNILDLSKIESGRMDIDLSLFSLAGLISDILENIGALAKEKGISIHVQIPEDLPPIESDKERIFQILQNIIANAIKFTEQGQISIQANVEQEIVQIQVQDTGIGIATEELSSIFEEFRQVDGGSARKFEGTGLGLAIAYQTALLLGGDIRVESTLGQGSTFTLILPLSFSTGHTRFGQIPLQRDAKERKSDTSMPTYIKTEPVPVQIPSTNTNSSQTILVVDDEAKIRDMLSAALIHQGYSVLTAASGQEALRLAHEHHPLAMTLDVIMPKMDGWEVLAAMKKDPRTANIPVIIVSVADDQETGFALGAVGYISKPVDSTALLNEMSKLCGRVPKTVMIVDDSEIDRKLATKAVSSEGMKVMLSDSGKACLTILENEVPDVLILDLMMPGMNGFEVLESLRAMPATKHLPVIIVTAKDLTQKEKALLEDRAASVLVKSETTAGEIVERIHAILQRITPFEEIPLVLGEDERAKREEKILLIEDSEAAVIQVKTALESIDLAVDVARDGQEGLDYLHEHIPCGVVLDLMMPNVDGFEVLENIRAVQATAHIPVLVLTAKELTRTDLDRLESNNIYQLIQKGDVDREELLYMVQTMLMENASIPSLPEPPVPPSGKARILVIEDNPDNMITMQAVLAGHGEILAAVNGKQGLAMAQEYLPDIIFLDMSLPAMDGIEVVNTLKSQADTQHIPVIALTAQAMKGDRERFLQAGCDEYISKPIDPELVMGTVSDYIGRHDGYNSGG